MIKYYRKFYFHGNIFCGNMVNFRKISGNTVRLPRKLSLGLRKYGGICRNNIEVFYLILAVSHVPKVSVCGMEGVGVCVCIV